MSIDDVPQLELRGKIVREDERGWICLDDIYTLAKALPSRSPKYWRRNQPVRVLIEELSKKVSASHQREKKAFSPVIYARRGRGSSGTFAHPVLAAAYAGYLSAKLEIEIREVWLRYRAADETLADDILQRASDEANRWAGTRALGRVQRNSYTATLKAHGVEKKGYMECTEATYLALLGGKSWQLRQKMGLGPKANLRNELRTDQLSYVMAAEALSAERIEEEDRRGNADCVEASRISASAIRAAVEADRKNRQSRLIP
jgi:hypothetical protein